MSLQKHLYNHNTVSEVLESYIKELSESSDIEKIIHANTLRAYQNLINDKSYLKDMRSLFNRTFDLLVKKYPTLRFSIAGRKKSLISTERKILQYLEIGQSLDLIRDFFAFRIILFGDNSLNLVEHCYKVTEEIIEFAMSNGFIFCDRLPLIEVADITKPRNDYFSNSKYKKFIKDYICYPKSNGYQSIHFVMIDPKGRPLEVQVRTLDMHFAIETGELSNHKLYKMQKYTLAFELDRQKINLDGYKYLETEKKKNDGSKYIVKHLMDFESIENPGTVFERQTL